MEAKNTARNILSWLLKTHRRRLNNEALSTLMTEVEAVMNSRPLTLELLSDGNSLNSISLSNLLTMKSKVVMSPSGEIGKADIYCQSAGEESNIFQTSAKSSLWPCSSGQQIEETFELGALCYWKINFIIETIGQWLK